MQILNTSPVLNNVFSAASASSSASDANASGLGFLDLILGDKSATANSTTLPTSEDAVISAGLVNNIEEALSSEDGNKGLDSDSFQGILQFLSQFSVTSANQAANQGVAAAKKSVSENSLIDNNGEVAALFQDNQQIMDKFSLNEEEIANPAIAALLNFAEQQTKITPKQFDEISSVIADAGYEIPAQAKVQQQYTPILNNTDLASLTKEDGLLNKGDAELLPNKIDVDNIETESLDVFLEKYLGKKKSDSISDSNSSQTKTPEVKSQTSYLNENPSYRFSNPNATVVTNNNLSNAPTLLVSDDDTKIGSGGDSAKITTVDAKFIAQDLNQFVASQKPGIALPENNVAANFKNIVLEDSAKVKADEVVAQIKFGVGDMLAKAEKHISIQLFPKDLGKVDIHMQLNSEGKSSVVILAERTDTLNLLQRESANLKTILENNLSTDAANLSFSFRERNGGNDNRFFEFEFDEKNEAVSEASNVRNVVAYSSALGSTDGLNIFV